MKELYENASLDLQSVLVIYDIIRLKLKIIQDN